MRTKWLILAQLVLQTLTHGSPLPTEWFSSPELTAHKTKEGLCFIDSDGSPYNGKYVVAQHYVSRRNPTITIGEALKARHYNLVDGKYEGEAQFLNISGLIEQRINYSNGMKNGLQTVNLKKFGADYHTITYRDDFMHGESKGYNKDGDLVWLVVFNEGVPATFDYKGEVFVGAIGKTIYSKSQGLIRPYMRDDEKFYVDNADSPFTGVSVTFYANGVVQSFSEYRDGKQEGVAYSNDESGEMRLYGEYLDGKKHGVFLHWTGGYHGVPRGELNSLFYEMDSQLQLGLQSIPEIKQSGLTANSVSRLRLSDDLFTLIETSKEEILNKNHKNRREFNQSEVSTPFAPVPPTP